MPDWLTHALLTWAAVEVVAIKWPRALRYRGIALIGAVVPDLGNFTMLLGEAGSPLSLYFTPLHSPLVVGLLVLGLSFVAKKKHHRMALLLLALGAYLHLAADFLIVTLTGKLPLLFPFSLELYGYGIFYQGGLLFPLIAGITAVAATALKNIRYSRRALDMLTSHPLNDT